MSKGLLKELLKGLLAISLGFAMTAQHVNADNYADKYAGNYTDKYVDNYTDKYADNYASNYIDNYAEQKKANLVELNMSKYQGKDWVLTNLAGEQVRLSKFAKQPVILVFWATWCPYCKKLLPGIERLHTKYANRGLTILAVNIKEDWQPKTYWRNHQYSFDALLGGDDVAEIYGVTGTPSVVFIEPSGKVLKVAQFSDPEHPSLEIFAQHFINDKATKN
jgi:thiol-disulfide isomerase/thioredoxin